jgi:hypothetical protein
MANVRALPPLVMAATWNFFARPYWQMNSVEDLTHDGSRKLLDTGVEERHDVERC